MWLHDSLIKRGRHIVSQSTAEMRRANITAAEPKSLARLDKSWCSNEMRSMAASTLELSNSMTITKIREHTRAVFSNNEMGRNTATGVKTINKNNSCLNALSSLKAYTKPVTFMWVLVDVISIFQNKPTVRLGLCDGYPLRLQVEDASQIAQ
jgi:hypothetical protein